MANTPIYSPNQITFDTHDPTQVAQWAQNEFQILSRTLSALTRLQLSVLNVAPSQPRTGMVAYADGTHWNPGVGEGLYEYTSGGLWVPSGAANANSAWTTYTPALSAASGTFTTASAVGYYKSIGKSVLITIMIIDTTNGTAAGYAVATLPLTPVRDAIYILVGQNTTIGFSINGTVRTTSGGLVNILKYDGTFPLASGQNLSIMGVYESV